MLVAVFRLFMATVELDAEVVNDVSMPISEVWLRCTERSPHVIDLRQSELCKLRLITGSIRGGDLDVTGGCDEDDEEFGAASRIGGNRNIPEFMLLPMVITGYEVSLGGLRDNSFDGWKISLYDAEAYNTRLNYYIC